VDFPPVTKGEVSIISGRLPPSPQWLWPGHGFGLKAGVAMYTHVSANGTSCIYIVYCSTLAGKREGEVDLLIIGWITPL